MTKRTESKCPTCSRKGGRKAPVPKRRRKDVRKRPYGTKGTNPYCHSCDMDYTYNVSKTSERMKAKRKIKEDINE